MKKRTDKPQKKIDNFRYDNFRVAVARIALFRIMISVMIIIFILSYMVYLSFNEKLFETVNNRISMLIWAMAGGMITLGFVSLFVDSWNIIRAFIDIEEEENNNQKKDK